MIVDATVTDSLCQGTNSTMEILLLESWTGIVVARSFHACKQLEWYSALQECHNTYIPAALAVGLQFTNQGNPGFSVPYGDDHIMRY